MASSMTSKIKLVSLWTINRYQQYVTVKTINYCKFIRWLFGMTYGIPCIEKLFFFLFQIIAGIMVYIKHIPIYAAQ